MEIQLIITQVAPLMSILPSNLMADKVSSSEVENTLAILFTMYKKSPYFCKCSSISPLLL